MSRSLKVFLAVMALEIFGLGWVMGRYVKPSPSAIVEREIATDTKIYELRMRVATLEGRAQGMLERMNEERQ